MGRFLCQGHETPLSTQVRRNSQLDEKKKKSCVTDTDAVNKCGCVSRTTILAAVAFLDAFQKVADMATNSRGKDFVFKILNSLTWWK